MPGSWQDLLLDTPLARLMDTLHAFEGSDFPLSVAATLVMQSRPALLLELKRRVGSSTSLSERQTLASLIGKYAKNVMGLEPPQTRMPNGSETHSALTIAGKADGFGAQLMAQMSGIAYCRHHGRSYIHTPFQRVAHLEDLDGDATPEAMDAFGSLGFWSGQSSNLSDLDRARVEIRPFCEEVAREPDVYFTADCRELLRRKHAQGTRQDFVTPACSSGPVVAVHIRRGDVTAEEHPSRFTDDDRYLDVILPALAGIHHGAALLIVSEGRAESFASLVAAADRLGFSSTELRLGGDPRIAFCTLVDAGVLVIAKSAFSYAAALLSRGVIYADEVRRGRWGWHRPISDWKRLQSAVSQPCP